MGTTGTELLRLSEVNNKHLREAALHYAGMGFRVVPLVPGGKHPLQGFHWKEDASTDPERIRGWWGEGATYPNANIGIVTGEKADIEDIDQKPGRDGWKSWIEAGGQADPVQPIQWTPNGGIHVLVPSDHRYRNFVGKGNHKGLDFRAANAYFVAAPSRINGSQYQWRDGRLVEPNEEIKGWLIKWSGEVKKRGDRGTLSGVEAENLTEAEIEEALRTMPDKPRRFLVEGHVDRADGDRSPLAYWAIRDLLQAGWSLPRLAAVLPACEPLMVMAEKHTGGEGWSWLWKYPVTSAWEDHQVDLRSRQKAFQAVAQANDIEIEEKINGEKETGEKETEEKETGEKAEGKTKTRVTRTIEQIEESLASQSEPVHTLSQINALLLEVVTLPNVDSFHLGIVADRLKGDGTPYGLSKSDLLKKLHNLQSQIRKQKALQALSADRHELYVRQLHKIYDTVSDALIDVRAFLVGIMRKKENEGIMEVDLKNQFLTSVEAESHVPMIENITWDPSQPSGIYEVGDGVRARKWYNTWRPSGIVPKAGDPSPWLDHVRRLQFIGGTPEEEAFFDYLAFIAQNPGIKVDHGALIGGLQQAGKDSAIYPALCTVGFPTPERQGEPENCKEILATELTSEFNTYLRGTKILVIEEIEKIARSDEAGVNSKLKTLTAAPPVTLRLRDLHQGARPIPNLIQVIAMTNFRASPIKPDLGDRRWLALWCGRDPMNDPDGVERIERYWGWLHNGGVEIVAHYLLTRDVRHFNPHARPLRTEWLKEMEQAAASPIASWALDKAACDDPTWAWPVLPEETIWAACKQALSLGPGGNPFGGGRGGAGGGGGAMSAGRGRGGSEPVTLPAMRAAFHELGWERRVLGRGRTPFWRIRGGAEAWDSVTRMGVADYRILIMREAKGVLEEICS